MSQMAELEFEPNGSSQGKLAWLVDIPNYNVPESRAFLTQFWTFT